MVEIKKNLVNESKYNIKCPYAMIPEFVIVHNTANDASASNEIAYMISNNNEVSYHYAVDDTEIVQGIPTNRNTWNAGDGGNGNGNRKGIAIEICYSKSGGDRFIKAEQNAAEFIASILKEYGWGIDKVKKHQDFNGKYCPHRTLDMGWDRFLNMINEYLGTSQGTSQTPKKSVEEVADEVIAGKWGNGAERSARLTEAGYNASEVQTVVNLKLNGSYKPSEPTLKSIDEVAQEVIEGKWGNGEERKNRLANAGYDVNAVQNKVNELLGVSPKKSNLKSIDEVAREVIQGKWGNGQERKDRLTAAGYDANAVQKRVNELM